MVYTIASWSPNSAMIFTLFPDRTLPVKSSRFIYTSQPSGIPGRFHFSMGVLHCANWKKKEKENYKFKSSDPVPSGSYTNDIFKIP